MIVQRRGDETYAFRHALMREAVYEDLLPGERGGLHVRLAEALEDNPGLSADSVGPAAELAWHWHQAHELPHAMRASIEAGEQADRMHAPADAARHLENAVDLWDRVDEPERVSGTTLVDLLRRAAEHNYIAGEYERAVALAGRVLELIGDSDPVAVAIARERLGRYLWTSGRHGESAKEYGQAVADDARRAPLRRAGSRACGTGLGAHAHRARGGLPRARRAGDRDRAGGRGHGASRLTPSTRSAWTSPRSGTARAAWRRCASHSRSSSSLALRTTSTAPTRTSPTSSTRTARWRRRSGSPARA